MKKILFAFLLICSFWNYGIGQIQYTGCNGAINAGYPITLNLAGNDGTRNFYVNTLPGTPCSAGTCAFRVIWTGSQWEIQLSTNGGASYPNTLYVNTSASLPDPPDLSLGTWVGQGPCVGQAISTWTGNVQSTTSTCSNPTVPTITSNPTSICAGSSTTLTISGTLNDATNWHIYTGSCGGTQIGMTSGSSFVVNPSANTTYFVRGEDGAGCVNEATGLCGSVMVTVNAIPSTPTISAGSATTFCTGGSVMLSSNASAGNQWMLNGSSIGGATSQTFLATGAGSYTVMSTVNGCSSAVSSATSVTVNAIPSTPIISAGGATTFCSGGSVTLTSSASTGNQWMLNGSPIGGATSQTLSATAGGNYTVMSTVNGCASAVSSATSVTVNAIPSTPTISAGSATTFCTGGSVMLTSSASTGNQWMLNGSPIGGATSQTLSATAGGNYTVMSTVNGCASAVSSATSVTVNAIPSTPTISAGGATTFCSGGSVTLTSSASAGNQWMLNGSPIGGATSQTLSATTGGNYTVMSTVNGCSSAVSSATSVTVNAIPSTPTISAGGATTFCSGGSVTLTSSASAGNQWMLNGSPIGGATSQTFSATTGGNYTVMSTVNGCASAVSSATTVTVNAIPSTPTISAGGATTFCSGGSVMLTSSASAGNQWMLNGSPIGGATSQTYSATTGGNYTVMSTLNGCASAVSSATAVTVNATPNAPTLNPAGSATICSGNSVTLTSSATLNQWFLNGTPISGANGQTFSATMAGSYTATAIANGCTSTASSATVVTVNATPMPVVTASATTICSGDSVTLTSSESMGNQWAVNGGLILGGNNQTLVVTTGGLYITQVTINGCTANSNSISINVLQTPNTPTISAAGATTFCTGDSVTLTSSATAGNQWMLNGSPIGGATSADLLVTTGGSYTVEVTGNGCTSAASAATMVTVNPNPITPSILAGSSTTFCTGDSVILNTTTASTGNQWMLNGSPIGGATNQTYSATTAGNYSVEFTVNGCSSTSAVLAVSVNSTATNAQTLVECAGTMVSIGSNVYTTSGTYTDTLTAANGCDSILTTTLTILSPVDTSITATLPTLTANASGASYQWVDCDSSYTPVAGATAQAYTPTANGNYAVIITDGNCSDTSSCYAVIITGIKNNKLTKMLTLFPNPTSGNLSIELGQTFEEVTIRVSNLAGQELSTKSFESTNQIDFNLEGTPGVYLLEVTTNEGDTTTIKVLKK